MTSAPPAQATTDPLLGAARALWPEPAVVRRRRTRSTGPEHVLRELVILPHRSGPRVALPGHRRRAAAAALSRCSADTGFGKRAAQVAAAAIARSGALERFARQRMLVTWPGCGTAPETIETRLSELLDCAVVVSLALGSARANQKPVLQVFDRTGRTCAFVKVGHTPPARDLVRGEAAALLAVGAAGLQRVRAPALLALEQWRGLELLVLSPVPARATRRSPAVLAPAMSELATAFGARTSELSASAYWRGLRATAPALTDDGLGRRFERVLDLIEGRHGPRDITLGSWHGDWAPWNMSHHDGAISLWDWERFEHDIPLGFDRLHYDLQVGIRRSGPTTQTYRRFLRQRPVPAGLERLLYLCTLTRRYLLAAQAEGGYPLRAQSRLVLEVLEEVTAS